MIPVCEHEASKLKKKSQCSYNLQEYEKGSSSDNEFEGFTETHNPSFTVKTCVPFFWFEHSVSLYNCR
jgi:hypothetical protein